MGLATDLQRVGSKMPQAQQDIIIVGAGLAGLNLAWQMKASDPQLKLQIVEKSKSCGGRMATRRIGESKFDHGAQFIKSAPVSKPLIHFWQQENILKKFPVDAFDASCGIAGMTQLAKNLAQNLDISYNCRVTKFEQNSEGWKIILEQGDPLFAKQIILTCPLPQALEILSQSNISFDPGLSQINYSKAIVQLVQFDSMLSSEMNYAENVDQNIFSVCSQHAKGLSMLAEYTIVMQPTWSEDLFSKSDDEILAKSEMLLQKKFSQQKILSLQVKKWKYCQPFEIWKRSFENPVAGVYLAGDAFGGASLNGALKSSESLAQHLMTTAKGPIRLWTESVERKF